MNKHRNVKSAAGVGSPVARCDDVRLPGIAFTCSSSTRASCPPQHLCGQPSGAPWHIVLARDLDAPSQRSIDEPKQLLCHLVDTFRSLHSSTYDVGSYARPVGSSDTAGTIAHPNSNIWSNRRGLYLARDRNLGS